MSSQVYSQSAKQPCSFREFGGETKPNAAVNQAPIPGFSQEQSISIRGLMTAFQIALDNVLDQHFGPLQQSNPTPPPPPTQPSSLVKKKRNQKTRVQYKRKKAQAQAQHVTIQVQEVDSVRISVEKVASKHVVLKRIPPWDWMTTSLHAVISWFKMTLFDGAIMVQNGAIGMHRMGVG